MSFDEYLFGKIAGFYKRRTAKRNESIFRVELDDIKARLLILARAASGKVIDIFPAEREGGFKGNNFFLPINYCKFDSKDKNFNFYLFRTLYLSVQQSLQKNWYCNESISSEESRRLALENSPEIVSKLLSEYTFLEPIYTDFLEFYSSEQEPDYSWIYGKYMKDTDSTELNEKLENLTQKISQLEQNTELTTLKAKPVEEVQCVAIDTKQQEDYVLTHNFEKVDTAEEFDGTWRDFDGDDDLKDHQEALKELKLKFTVRVDDTAHSVYEADFLENITLQEVEDVTISKECSVYNEWDFKKGAYRQNFCKVFVVLQNKIDPDYYKNTITQYKSILVGLRKMLSSINNRWMLQRKQLQGNEFDIDATVDMLIDLHTKHTPSENIYLSNRKKDKDISIMLLLDLSLSSDGYADGNRIIDVEKQTTILFAEILNEFGVDFAIACFFSQTRNYSEFLILKKFDESWDSAKFKIGVPQPNGYTRIGAALRHAGELLKVRPTQKKWVVLLSDGKPNDFDKYEGQYGVQDVKQALRELKENNVESYALAIESTAKYYLPQMFGSNHYQILSSPIDLIHSLVKLYERIKY